MKDIVGYEGYYKITRDGNVFSIRANRFLSLNYKKNGYVYVELNVKGVATMHRVHRLVAEAFIPNPDNKEFVHHIDNIKSHNEDTNLEWTTVSENTKRAFDDGLITHPNIKTFHLKLGNKIVASAYSHNMLRELTGYSSPQLCTYIRTGNNLLKGMFKGHKITIS